MGNACYSSFMDNHLIFQPSMNPVPMFQYVQVIFSLHTSSYTAKIQKTVPILEGVREAIYLSSYCPDAGSGSRRKGIFRDCTDKQKPSQN